MNSAEIRKNIRSFLMLADLPKKEILYIVNNLGESVAFVLQDLVDVWNAEIMVWNTLYKATYNDWLVDITLDWKILPWYYEMWFSWVNQNINTKNIWMKK